MDKKKRQRTFIFYKNYFDGFFREQKQKVKDKIIWTFDLIEELQRVPEIYLKHLENTEGTSLEYSASLTKDNWWF